VDFALLGCLLLLAMLASSRASAEPAIALRGDTGERYFIEFRARPGPFIGHTYVVYGRIDAAGHILDVHSVGLAPDGNPVVGAFVPVAGSVRQDKNDAKYNPNAIYRRPLSAAEYVHVSRFVDMLRAREHEWHLIFQNCNDFAATIADGLGLRRPPAVMPPSMWVGMLRLFND
jgi:hypothetical protein